MRALAILVILLAVIAATGARARPIALPTPDARHFNTALLVASNAARREAGLPPLRLEQGLMQAATRQAEAMADLGQLAHVLPVPGAETLDRRLKRQSVGFRRAAENIALDKAYRLLGRPIAMGWEDCAFFYGDTGAPVPIHSYASLAAQVVARWLASPKHRASLLSPAYRRLGGGVAFDPGGTACGDLYLVQVLAD